MDYFSNYYDANRYRRQYKDKYFFFCKMNTHSSGKYKCINYTFQNELQSFIQCAKLS